MLEIELYPPIKEYFEAAGYEVKSEVKDCDVIARKADELIVVEMKTRLNLELILQGVERQRISTLVYLAVPNTTMKGHLKRTKQLIYLLRRLELGLIIVHDHKKGHPIDIIHHPALFDMDASRKRLVYKKTTLLKEFDARKGDNNTGGQTRKKIITAYREENVRIARIMLTHSPISGKVLKSLGCGTKSSDILRTNYYGWFDKVERGLYQLNDKGKKEMQIYDHLIL